jgi:hypothetical protein
MIGSLLYLTVMRSDIQFSVCLCAHFQASQRTLHRQAVKRIFTNLRYTPDFGIWYFTSSSLALHGVWTQILLVVTWIGSPHWGIVSFFVLPFGIGLRTSS